MARREEQSVVEVAEVCDARQAEREPAAAFYAGLAAGAEDKDIDLEAILREDRHLRDGGLTHLPAGSVFPTLEAE